MTTTFDSIKRGVVTYLGKMANALRRQRLDNAANSVARFYDCAETLDKFLNENPIDPVTIKLDLKVNGVDTTVEVPLSSESNYVFMVIMLAIALANSEA